MLRSTKSILHLEIPRRFLLETIVGYVTVELGDHCSCSILRRLTGSPLNNSCHVPTWAPIKLSRYVRASLLILYSVECYFFSIESESASQLPPNGPGSSYSPMLSWQLGHLKPREGRRSILTTADGSLVVKLTLEPKSPLVYNVLPRICPSLGRAAPAPKMICHSPDDSSLNLLPIVSHQWAEDQQLLWLRLHGSRALVSRG